LLKVIVCVNEPVNEELSRLAWSCQNVDKLGVGFIVPTVWSEVVNAVFDA